MKIISLIKSFKCAWHGIALAVKSERNMRIHIIIAILVLLCAFFLQVNILQLTILLLTIALVLVVELINTALEKLIDLIHPEYHERAGKIKDISAGAVLVAAIFAVLIGICIFGVQILTKSS